MGSLAMVVDSGRLVLGKAWLLDAELDWAWDEKMKRQMSVDVGGLYILAQAQAWTRVSWRSCSTLATASIWDQPTSNTAALSCLS